MTCTTRVIEYYFTEFYIYPPIIQVSSALHVVHVYDTHVVLRVHKEK